MREKDRFGGKESERAQCEGSCGKSRSFTYDRKRICVTTPNVDVNKVRKRKIRKGNEKGKMNVGRRKTTNRESERRVKLLELEIKPERMKLKDKEAREIAPYRASICRKGRWIHVLGGEVKGGRWFCFSRRRS